MQLRDAARNAVLTVGLCLAAASAPLEAQDVRNILLVINEASTESERIGAHYMRARALPADQVLRLKTSAVEQISREQFVGEIERPVAGWLARNAAQDRILYIVLTKGIPLRIAGTDGPQGTVASVDSELALLYRLLAGSPVPTAGPLPNGYFLNTRSMTEAAPFSHKDHDIYLVSRLDGFTADDAMAIIDRAAAPAREGQFLLDQKATLVDRGGDAWLTAAAENLAAAGLKDRVVLDTTRQVLSDRKPVLGYFSWGSNDPAITKRDLNLGFAPGALAATFVSTDARTLKPPPSSWVTGTWEDRTTFFEGSPQSLTGDLIRAGVTGVAGNVAEPYLAGAVRPQILFPAYVRGLNLIESFYLAMPYLSWQTIVVGDPLCAPFRKQGVPVSDATPPPDAETELPKFFSDRRLAALAAIGIDPRAAKLSLKAEARMARGDRNGALQALEMATALDPRLIVDQFTLANRYLEGGDFDKSIERYRTILATAPSEMRSANNLAYTLAVNKKNPTEALPLAEKAYRLSRATRPASVAEVLGNASIADTLGWIHFLLGDGAQAERYLNEAVAGAPNNPEIHLHLAQVHQAAGRTEAASAALSKAISLDASLEKREEVVKLRRSLPAPPPAK